jgi:hypothetical protein
MHSTHPSTHNPPNTPRAGSAAITAIDSIGSATTTAIDSIAIVAGTTSGTTAGGTTAGGTTAGTTAGGTTAGTSRSLTDEVAHAPVAEKTLGYAPANGWSALGGEFIGLPVFQSGGCRYYLSIPLCSRSCVYTCV